MPVTRPLLSCSPFLSFQSALRASGQSCAQCPSFLHNLHFVQLEKSCSLLAHTVHISCAASRAALICTTASCTSLPLSFSAPRCSCLFIQRLAAVVLAENSEVGVEFQCTPAEPLCVLYSGGAGLTVFSCGKHKHTVS